MVNQMNATRYAGALALALLLAACGKEQTTAPETQDAAEGRPTSNAVAEIYSGTGTIQLISGDKVATAHGPIEGIGWPAMTMTFTAPPGTAEAVKAGSRVDFSFQQDGSAFVLTSLRPR